MFPQVTMPAHRVDEVPESIGTPEPIGGLRSLPAWVLAMALGVAALLVFYRVQVRSGLDTIMGDEGDQLLIISLLEHWHRVYSAHAPWLSPAFFYPVKGTLGYSDGFFVHGLIYSALRAAGLDAFLAFQSTLVILSAFGYATALLLLTRVFRIAVPLAAVGAACYTVSNALFFHAGHSQMFAIFLVPSLALLYLEYWKMPDRRRAAGWLLGLGAIALQAIIFCTSFYVGWGAALCLGVGTLVALWLRGGGVRGRLRYVAGLGRTHARQWLAFGAVALLAMAPFLMIYVPAARTLPSRSWDDAKAMLPSLVDFANVSTGNIVWGRFLGSVDYPARPSGFELTYGCPFLLLGLFVATLTVSVWTRGIAGARSSRADGRRDMDWVRLLGFTVLAVWVLLLKVHDYSLWAVVRKVLPGASALRAMSRLLLVVQIPLIVVALLGLQRAIVAAYHGGMLRRLVAIAALVLTCGMLLAEQINRNSASYLSRPEQLARLSIVAAPPEACHSFFLAPVASRTGQFWVAYQTHAMLIAEFRRIPTIHGYSGWSPPSWPLLDPEDPEYLVRVKRWLVRNQIQTGACMMDAAGHWHAVDTLP